MTGLRVTRRWVPTTLLAVALGVWPAAQDLTLPNVAGSVKFGVIGDAGTGDPEQFQVANVIAQYHAKFAFDRIIMLGDNIYGGQGARDLQEKFEQPYKALLNAGVKFYAALGNHDNQANRSYPLWNMGGERYYTWSMKNVRFFVLDSDQLDPKQRDWIEKALKDSKDDWKICYFHHPLYSDGATHGSSVDLRVILEPLFVNYGVDVVFSGHDHIYERVTPQKGIVYFVSGAAGTLRRGDTRRSPTVAASFDQDLSFMLVEIAGNTMSFQSISRTGKTVDSGQIQRHVRPAPGRQP